MKEQKITELFEQYLPMVKARIRDAIEKTGLEFGDLLTVAWEVFRKAALSYDPEKGSLSAWLNNRVQWGLMDYAKEEWKHAKALTAYGETPEQSQGLVARPKKLSKKKELTLTDPIKAKPFLKPLRDIAPDTEDYMAANYPDCNIFGLDKIAERLPWGNKHAKTLFKNNSGSIWHRHEIETKSGRRKIEYATHTNSADFGATQLQTQTKENLSRSGEANLEDHNIVWIRRKPTNISSGTE